MRAQDRENIRYSQGNTNPIEKTEELLFSLLPDSKAKRLLDVGCGVGVISQQLESKGFEVTGVDFSKVGVDKCLEKGLNAIVSDVDQDGLKFPDKSFDVVWAGDVIEHVFDPIFLFQEMSRVLKDDGLLLATVPNNFNLRQRWRLVKSGKSIQSSVYKKLGQCKHHTFFSWDLLEYMLDKAGFKIESFYSICGRKRKGKDKVTTSVRKGRLFGRVFIFRASKRQGND